MSIKQVDKDKLFSVCCNSDKNKTAGGYHWKFA